MKQFVQITLVCLTVAFSGAAVAKGAPFDDKFRQLDELLPTPNTYRTASGAPGHQYWQQEVDYDINITLDDKTQRLTGSETLDYTNNSPDTLRYVWIQLDQNRMKRDSDYKLANKAPKKKITYKGLRNIVETDAFDGGYEITKVTDSSDKPMKHIINGTMMRIDLAKPLKPGKSVEINIDWNYQLHEQKVLGGRSGWEYFKKRRQLLVRASTVVPARSGLLRRDGLAEQTILGQW